MKQRSVGQSRDSAGQTDSTDHYREGQGQTSNHEPPGGNTDMNTLIINAVVFIPYNIIYLLFCELNSK